MWGVIRPPQTTQDHLRPLGKNAQCKACHQLKWSYVLKIKLSVSEDSAQANSWIPGGYVLGSWLWSSVNDPVTSPEGLQLSTSCCRDTGHNHTFATEGRESNIMSLCVLENTTLILTWFLFLLLFITTWWWWWLSLMFFFHFLYS